ncbi:BZIP-type transcription factor [Phlyctema vagabunda]|uniref:BZIP-type transcription factor n=1 Tax=Phlyctema vagabunda TaxID=108571 RepID=A0ABR4P2T8_9HELO
MASLSPVDQYTNKSGSGYGSGGQSDNDASRSPLSMSLGFLKNLTEKKTTRVDGQPPKRRGPKPDAKPALTRRQELNRQAQRTHRERKELYIKALEAEVQRLKESFSNVTRDKDSVAEENRQLKALLAQHGIPWNGTGGVDELSRNGSHGLSSSPSMSGSYTPGSAGLTPPPHAHGTQYSASSSMGGNHGRSMAQQQVQRGVDYDQAGIDFVLTLEKPCMDHMQFLVERASEPDGEPCGHALMASCPPDAYMDNHPEIPFGHTVHHAHGDEDYKPKTWDVSAAGLANLLRLSKTIPDLNGECTPVMVWGMIIGHERFSMLNVDDIEEICDALKGKVKCYGFGAVMEEFEARDAIENVLSKKELGMGY